MIYWGWTLQKEFEETALKAPSEIDARALMWTYGSLDEDHELEHFFAGIPGFCRSKVVDNPQFSLDSLRSPTVDRFLTLSGFLERTWLSNLVPEIIKIQRTVICVRAIDAAHLAGAAHEILYEFERRPTLFLSVELGHSLMNLADTDDRETSLFAQAIIASIIANVPQRNERWFSLTMHHLGISEHVLRSYLDHGDSVLLANLIHFIRQFVRNFLKANWGEFPIPHTLSGLGFNYNVQSTLSGLQHNFCGLWNEILLQSNKTDHPVLFSILGEIRHIYVALHQDYAMDGQYQLCGIPDHRIGSAANLNEVDCGRTAETARAPITSPTLYHHDPVPSIILPGTEYDAPPPTSNLDYAIPYLVDEQSRTGVLDNITPVASSFHLAPLKNDPISDGTAADPVQGTTDPSSISSVVDTGFCPTSNYGTASRLTGNMTTTTLPFVPDTVASPIPLLTVSPDSAARHISADPTVNESGGPQDDGSISLSPSQLPTPFKFPLSPEVISGFDSNATTEIGPLDAPDDTLDPNRRLVSQPLT